MVTISQFEVETHVGSYTRSWIHSIQNRSQIIKKNVSINDVIMKSTIKKL
jgi:hypothetical protein